MFPPGRAWFEIMVIKNESLGAVVHSGNVKGAGRGKES